MRDGLRAVKNTLIDKAVIPGAGAFEAGLFVHLNEVTKKTVEGRAKRGVEAFAEAMLVIPKTLAENSGYDAQDAVISLTDEHENGNIVGIDVTTGEPFDPTTSGVYDNYLGEDANFAKRTGCCDAVVVGRSSVKSRREHARSRSAR